jgi:uncharacterized protein (TIGR03435 family)
VLKTLLICAIALAAHAQTFDVAELKLTPENATGKSVVLSNGRFIAHNIPLRPLIAEAWMMTPDGVIGPSFLDNTHVEIGAKAASPQTSDADLRLMIQTLFKDRLQLRSHIEQRRQRVYALTIWKGRPQLKPADSPNRAEDGDCDTQIQAKSAHATCTRMERLVHELPQMASRWVDQRVVDQTNLKGAWDFTLDWADTPEDPGLSLFGALEAQTGLQLKPKRLAVPVLVIDNINRIPN